MAYSDEVAVDTPRIWWKLGESSGEFADSGTQNASTDTINGTPTYGVTPFGAVDGTAITLDGATRARTTDDYTPADPDSISIEAWIKTTQSTNSGGILEAGANGPSFRLDGSTGTLELIKSHSAFIAASTASVNDGEWHHVVVTKNGSTVHFYVDGIEGTGTVTNATLNDNSNNTGFGAQWLAGGTVDANTWYTGSLQHIAVYDGALSQARVTAHYEAAFAEPLLHNVITPTARW